VAKIIIADDDGNLRGTLEEVLADAGYETMSCASGDIALSTFEELVAAGTPPAAMLVDLLLPKVAGFDLMAKVGGPNCPALLIAMSGIFKGGGHQEQAAENGAKRFFEKPFDNDELVSYLDGALAEAGVAIESDVEQMPMPAEGTLLEAPAFHLLWRAEREKHSGVLDLFTEAGRARIFVYRGQATLAQHFSTELNVGFELIRSGSLTPQMYQEATDEAVERGSGISEIIKANGWVRDAELKNAYKALVPKILRRVVALSGNFRWTDTDEFAQHIPAASTKMLKPLLAGIREADPAELAAHVEPRGVLRLAPGDNWRLMLPHLDAACGSDSISRAINGRATITQMLGAARNEQDRAARLKQVFLLMSTQAVHASMEVMKVDAADLALAPEAPAPAAAPEPVAPDPMMAAAPVMSAPTAGGGDEALDAGIEFNAEETDARERIQMKWDMCKGKNYWEVLSVDREASAGDIKKAYFTLAREYHADAFAGMRLGSKQSVLDELFSLISTAYETLTNDDKRGEYEASQSMEEAGMSSDLGALFEAERDFDKGKLLLERGEMLSALKFFEKAITANPANKEWQAHVVFTRWYQGRDPNTAADVSRELELLWKEQENLFDVAYMSGRIAMEAGLLDKANRVFRKILESRPDHALTLRDRRALQKKIDDEVASKKKGGGLLGRLKR
jgi:curved DNA-binding protein CbpA/DNA-binding response OmpR family regulator